jgi:hypothetical protein
LKIHATMAVRKTAGMRLGGVAARSANAKACRLDTCRRKFFSRWNAATHRNSFVSNRVGDKEKQ